MEGRDAGDDDLAADQPAADGTQLREHTGESLPQHARIEAEDNCKQATVTVQFQWRPTLQHLRGVSSSSRSCTPS